MISLKGFDIFQSPSYDVVESKPVGGALTLTSFFICAVLFLSEISSFRRGWLKEMVYLEETKADGNNHVRVTLDISLVDVPCKYISLDIQDQRGRYEIDEHDEGDLFKENKSNGCRFHGFIWVRRTAGNFHFTPRGKHSNDTIKHVITELSFGDYHDVPMARALRLESFTSLKYNDQRMSNEGMTHDYLIKLVQTELWDSISKNHIYPYQYTYTHREFVGHHRGKPTPPKIYFRLEFSPLTMKFTRTHMSLWVFLTRHLAILGGVFAIIKMIYSTFFVAKDTIKSISQKLL